MEKVQKGGTMKSPKEVFVDKSVIMTEYVCGLLAVI